MTISQTQLDQALSEPILPRFWRGYFQEAFREQVQQQLLEHFEYLKGKTGLSRSELARKIERRPEQVTRWLSSPTNLESDTIADVALGMGLVPKITFEAVRVGTAVNTNQAHSVQIKTTSTGSVATKRNDPHFQPAQP